jgi:hypothetical protein
MDAVQWDDIAAHLIHRLNDELAFFSRRWRTIMDYVTTIYAVVIKPEDTA